MSSLSVLTAPATDLRQLVFAASAIASPFQSAPETDTPTCGNESEYNGRLGLRVAAIFIILVTSAVGTLFPVLTRRSKMPLSDKVYLAFKMFGSGVLVATAFIHLLAPAFEALTSPCLKGTWTDYDWAPALSMAAVLSIWIVELVAHRWGRSYLKRRGLKSHDPHSTKGGSELGHTGHGQHVADSAQEGLASPQLERAATIEEIQRVSSITNTTKLVDLEDGLNGDSIKSSEVSAATLVSPGSTLPHLDSVPHEHTHEHEHSFIDESSLAQIIGVGILEFGVILHSFIIGLTLAVNAEFVPLFCVLIFHQAFEGIGLGSRLSGLPLPSQLSWVPIFGAILYSCITPLGISIGLGIRTVYNPESTTSSIVSGILDACSSGILLWAGIVECLAHDFVFDRKMAEASNGEVAFCIFFVLLGAGLMALLGRWA
ncbi:uncharacterized protein JCM15063_005045 [Sporobolomyces koalae]|uniref:uncharacterized protein n=1 Tax=Sporobolomyces koalae TaxID=500713 RepID=UPI00316EF023